MGFKFPERLQNYIESTKNRVPFAVFSAPANYYAQLNYEWIDYMQNVVRPCAAYACGFCDGVNNTQISAATGLALAKGATRLVVGDRIFYNGDDISSKFLSDIWSVQTNFPRTLKRAFAFMFDFGTSVAKINKDARGRNTIAAVRLDRSSFTTDDNGDVTEAVFYISFMPALKGDGGYWLVEERKYINEQPAICYKIQKSSGTAKNPVLPDSNLNGLSFNSCPRGVQRELSKLGINELNVYKPLPTRDGLGVWLLSRTAENSCIPDSFLGDPLLYGCQDLLWSIDVVFSGTIVDVINGEGKILVPKQFLSEIVAKLGAQGVNITTSELKEYAPDPTFVYIQPSTFDKDKQSPTPVQFDIRADAYGKMWEIYERAICTRAGFSPTSIFPYLTPDNSSKTATEITAEENLTRATIREIHDLNTPTITRMLREVLYQEGLSDDIQVQLTDYIGNKTQFDANIRDNLASGIISQIRAIKQVNNYTDNEANECLAEIKKDEEEKRQQENAFGYNNGDFYGVGGDDNVGESKVEPTGADT